MKIIPVRIEGLKKTKTLFALLDDGSTATIIDSKIIDEIGAVKHNIKVGLKGFGIENEVTLANKKTDLIINISAERFSLKNVLIVEELALPKQELSKNITKMCYD